MIKHAEGLEYLWALGNFEAGRAVFYLHGTRSWEQWRDQRVLGDSQVGSLATRVAIDGDF